MGGGRRRGGERGRWHRCLRRRADVHGIKVALVGWRWRSRVSWPRAVRRGGFRGADRVLARGWERRRPRVAPGGAPDLPGGLQVKPAPGHAGLTCVSSPALASRFYVDTARSWAEPARWRGARSWASRPVGVVRGVGASRPVGAVRGERRRDRSLDGQIVWWARWRRGSAEGFGQGFSAE